MRGHSGSLARLAQITWRYPEFLNAFLKGETRLVVVERLESPPGKFAAGQLPDRGRDELKADSSFQYAAASY